MPFLLSASKFEETFAIVKLVVGIFAMDPREEFAKWIREMNLWPPNLLEEEHLCLMQRPVRGASKRSGCFFGCILHRERL